MEFDWLLDLTVIASYFVLILWIGLRKGRDESTFEDFALGGRRIPWWAVLGSIIAAETSAGTFIGTPGEGYSLRNYTFLQLVLGTIIARVIIGFTFLKPFYRYNVYSIYEFLLIRFGTRTRNMGSGLFLLTRVLASGTRLYISAVILVLAYKMFLNVGVQLAPGRELMIYVGAITILTASTTLYTALGGIKAVIWTDMIQATIMLGSGLIAIFVLYHGIPGGWSTLRSHLNGFRDVTLFESGIISGRGVWTNVKSILGSDYTLFAALLGSTFTTLATHGTDQDMVQRMLTAPDPRRSRRALLLSGVMDIPIVLIFLTIGILLYVFYQIHPDPLLPTKTNEVFCHFILSQIPAGLRGLMIAGIFATTMGSLSAALNALATSFVRDWYHPFIRPGAGERDTLRCARIATVVFSALMIGVASCTAYLVILSPKSRIIPIALGIFGYTYGSLLGVFMVGMFTRARGSDRGNVFAMIAGFLVVAVLSGLPNDLARFFNGARCYPQPEWLPLISFPWRVFFGAVTTFGVATAFKTPLRVEA